MMSNDIEVLEYILEYVFGKFNYYQLKLQCNCIYSCHQCTFSFCLAHVTP
jgi:hypothetical protein